MKRPLNTVEKHTYCYYFTSGYLWPYQPYALVFLSKAEFKLLISGNSVSQSQTEYLEPDSEWSRVRRQAEDTTTTSSPQEEEKPAKALPKYALYNATGKITISSLPCCWPLIVLWPCCKTSKGIHCAGNNIYQLKQQYQSYKNTRLVRTEHLFLVTLFLYIAQKHRSLV